MSDSGIPHEHPLDHDAEAGILAALHAEYFARRSHRFVYAALCETDGRGKGSGVLETAALLERDGRPDACGGMEGLRALAATAAPAPLERCAEIVRERALRRRLIEAGETILKHAHDPGDAKAKLDHAQTVLGVDSLLYPDPRPGAPVAVRPLQGQRAWAPA